MSLKDNFNQAVREILKKDGVVQDDKNSKKKTELDRYLEPPKPTTESSDIVAEEKIKDSISEFKDIPEKIAIPEPVAYNESPYIKPEQSVEQFGDKSPKKEREIFTIPKTPANSGMAVSDKADNEQSAQTNSPFSQFSQFARQNGAVSKAEEEPRGNSNPQSAFGSGAAGSGGFGSAGSLSSGLDYASSGYGSTGGAVGGFGNSGGSGTPPIPPKNPRANNSPYGKQPDSPYYETEETTVISRNTIVDGNIRSFANINVDGSVKGDVKITKNINITGKIVGDIECNNSVMAGASMQGNIISKGQVQIDRDSLLLGDISAQYLDLNGKIKGNLDVGGKAEFKTDAIILGNITASTITVLDGATIQGYVNTTFLQESSSSIFPEAIALTD